MRIHKIVLTGGPSAGKTTGLSWIQNSFTKLGYTVLFIPETATELISGGVAPWSCSTNLAYQKLQMRLQLEKERLFEEAARGMKAEKILIVCDRGALDNRAYMNEEEFAAVLESVGETRESLLRRYDAIFHLVTAARGAEQFYTMENNKARYESVSEAVALDDRLIAAWEGHPEQSVIDNAVDFSHKMRRLIAQIRRVLGEPEPLEIVRKFLITCPNTAWLEQRGARRVEIFQAYLAAKEGEELRIRELREGGKHIYYKTLKRRLSDRKRLEIEERLSRSDYLRLLKEADPALGSIRKTRYCLEDGGLFFQIDVYPFWDEQALMEVELSDENASLSVPEGISMIREVTGEKEYSNAALARL